MENPPGEGKRKKVKAEEVMEYGRHGAESEVMPRLSGRRRIRVFERAVGASSPETRLLESVELVCEKG